MKKILTIFGTRPEAIKLAPVIKELNKRQREFVSIIGLTGQHDEMLQQVLEIFAIQHDFNIKVMRENQSLPQLTARILLKITEKLREYNPDIILVQGDTTTVFATTVAAYYAKIKIAHVEAGLRTYDKYQPFPEELNRRFTDQVSDFLFAPTEQNRINLIREGIEDGRIYITGNTIVDALLEISANGHSNNISSLPRIHGKVILLTVHRRENFGKPVENIFKAVRELAENYGDMQFVYPVHPNPNVRNVAHNCLQNLPNVHLIPPVDYVSFVQLMKRAYLILTDSGGIQEEAPTLRKPVIVLRDRTERGELVNAGGAKVVGSDKEKIVYEVRKLVENESYYRGMTEIVNPFGDGKAAERIVEILGRSL
jgi:UDP-N-acetylglucosamine 2-epimerase (non-hydrolysing)